MFQIEMHLRTTASAMWRSRRSDSCTHFAAVVLCILSRASLANDVDTDVVIYDAGNTCAGGGWSKITTLAACRSAIELLGYDGTKYRGLAVGVLLLRGRPGVHERLLVQRARERLRERRRGPGVRTRAHSAQRLDVGRVHGRLGRGLLARHGGRGIALAQRRRRRVYVPRREEGGGRDARVVRRCALRMDRGRLRRERPCVRVTRCVLG